MIDPEQSTRKITFSLNQLQLAEYKAKKLGISFQEYIRHLVSKDVENLLEKFDILDIEEVKKLEQALDEKRNTKFTLSINKNNFQKFLSQLKSDKPN